jgi:hypothetical protein
MSQDNQSVGKARRSVFVSRFVVYVDGQQKAGFAERDLAEAEAARIRLAFPRVAVSVTDQDVPALSAADEAE